MVELATRLLVGFFPVVLFLLCLIYLDSYKLIGLRLVLLAIAAGGLAAGLGYLLNLTLLTRLGLDLPLYSRYVAPIIEETLKALVLAYFIRSHKIGFLVDAAIFGFAIGAGFAMIENLYYLNLLPDARLPVWIIRGFGTAIMHGGTTAIFGIVSKTLADRKFSASGPAFVPGLLMAIVVHSFFNHFFFSPLFSTLAILLALPPLVLLVFQRSEKSLQEWLGVGFDADAELLALINSGQLSTSKVGSYLQSLREKFRGEVVADMLCYLRLHTELSLRAKGELMMRECGFRSDLEPDIKAKFEEMKYLERSIGKTGRLAMAPFLHVSGKALWQLYMLESK
jgi:RsiW-degrading membrane proteinase PrsW (M82 family)